MKQHKQYGAEAEQRAADYLKDRGFQILERNYRFHRNEIDIIALDGRTLCFVEVKCRSSTDYGYGCEAVTLKKQQCIRKVAAHYLTASGHSQAHPCRFDVISIDAGRITHYPNAF